LHDLDADPDRFVRKERPPAVVRAAMARRAIGWILMLMTLALVGCDHATKAVAQSALAGRGPVTLLSGVLDLRYAENHDTAFSLLRGVDWHGKVAALAALSAIEIAVVLYLWWRHRRSSLAEQAGYALIVAGAIGNVLDRVRRGFVIDFIHLHRWPVFNVADIAIVAGGLLLLLTLVRRPRGTAAA
jgi:signal peptidase II